MKNKSQLLQSFIDKWGGRLLPQHQNSNSDKEMEADLARAFKEIEDETRKKIKKIGKRGKYNYPYYNDDMEKGFQHAIKQIVKELL